MSSVRSKEHFLERWKIGELRRAFAVTVDALPAETRSVDPDLADRIADPLRDMAR